MNQGPYQPPSDQNWPYQEQPPYGYGQPSQPLPPNTQWGQQQPYPPYYAQPEHYVQPGTYYRPPAQMMPPPQVQWQQPAYQPPAYPQPPIKQTSHAMRNAIIVFIVFVVFSGAGIRFLQSFNAPLPAMGGTWTTTHTFSGNGVQKTAIFSISSDWKLFYTCTYQQIGSSTTVEGYLGVSVYNADGTMEDVAVNSSCKQAKTTGETEEHVGGNIYLAMNGTGDWSIQIQELK